MNTDRIIDIRTLESAGPAIVDPSLWTGIVPAAGRGSRLAWPGPKLLFPVRGRPMLEWIVDLLDGVCERLVFVLSPGARPAVEPRLQDRLPGRIAVVEQPTPGGMAEAVWLASGAVKTPFVLVIWGDQVCIRGRTPTWCASLHQQRPGATLTLPTAVRSKPYTHLRRDPTGALVEVLQDREREMDREEGESDCGLFLFTRSFLFDVLDLARHEGRGVGQRTGEFNLLPLLPLFERGGRSVVSVRINDPGETVGVNSLADAAVAESILGRREAGELV